MAALKAWEFAVIVVLGLVMFITIVLVVLHYHAHRPRTLLMEIAQLASSHEAEWGEAQLDSRHSGVSADIAWRCRPLSEKSIQDLPLRVYREPIHLHESSPESDILMHSDTKDSAYSEFNSLPKDSEKTHLKPADILSEAFEKISMNEGEEAKRTDPKPIAFIREYELKQSECGICLEDFVHEDELRCLPCCHHYHRQCIDVWLIEHSSNCPLCKQNSRTGSQRP